MRFRSLRTRITVWTITAMLLIPVTVGVVIIVKQFALAGEVSKTIRESDGIFKATLLRDLEHAMMVDQLEGARAMLRKVSSFDGIKGVSLLDVHGGTVLSYGRVPSPRLDGKQTKELFEEGREVQVFMREDGESVRLVALPILNKEQCRVCHASSFVNGALLIKQRSVDVNSETGFLVGIMLLSLLVASLASALTLLTMLSKTVVGPIRELSGAAERVGRYGLDVDVPVRGDDEVGELALSLNRMMGDLRKAYDSMRAARRKLVQSEKLAAIGTLVAGIAHEINNPVGIITARADCMLMESREKGIEGHCAEDLMVINRQAGRIAEITRSLLKFARQAPAELCPVDINAIVEDTVFLVSKQLAKEGITIEKRLGAGLPRVTANDNRLQQVLLDLLNNARDAMPGGGTIIVATASSADKAEITIADTGEGIPEEVLDNIFDPFFTTKEIGKGTGLGLAVSYGIIQDFGGSIEVLSRVGEGTKFNIVLPALKGAPA